MVGVRVGVEEVDLTSLDLVLEGVELGAEIGGDVVVGLAVEQLGEVARVAGTAVEAVPPVELVAQPRRLLAELPGAARVVPEVGGGELGVEVAQPPAPAGKVKDAPGAG